jgi:hypothetical protein
MAIQQIQHNTELRLTPKGIRFYRLWSALQETISNLQALTVIDLSKLCQDDIELLDNFVVFVDDIK